jgi:hypothetical protein
MMVLAIIPAMRRATLATASVVVTLAAANPAPAQSPRQPNWADVERETLEHFQALLRLDTRNPPGNERCPRSRRPTRLSPSTSRDTAAPPPKAARMERRSPDVFHDLVSCG